MIDAAEHTRSDEYEIPQQFRPLLELSNEEVLDLTDNEFVRELIEILGVEAALKLVHQFGGQGCYFPRLDTAFLRFRDRRIRSEFNGYNYRELQERYQITKPHLLSILRNDPAAPQQQNWIEDSQGGQ